MMFKVVAWLFLEGFACKKNLHVRRIHIIKLVCFSPVNVSFYHRGVVAKKLEGQMKNYFPPHSSVYLDLSKNIP